MNIFKKYDRIRAPYSTIISLTQVVLLGVFLIFWPHDTRLLGVGIILGGFLAMLLKTACEISDREAWARVRAFFGGKRDNNSH